MCRKIFLLRHGTPQRKDSQRRYIGLTDIKLSENGRREAEAAGLWLKDKAIKKVYVSPLIRALETAKIVANFAGLSAPIIAQDLREINLGEWEEKTINEIRENYTQQFEERGRHSWDFRITGGETFHEAHERFSGFLTSALASTKGNILLVTL